MKNPPSLGRCVFNSFTKNKRFVVRLYESGIQQYMAPLLKMSWSQAIKERTKPRVYLERYVPRKTEHRLKDRCNARRKWALVLRDSWSDVRRFAPIYAGPFESLELALLAWELMS